ncbi:hypothetical protein KAFR_0B01030 [Kazachstania africana CBS 2517]|uniref:2-dehydropantoate 2-reductase n=1 Tax=Kazachstania africana (strain ATCC 22294 / BCRC 22015 / CBS 2517 / CECT 1963 / NBRC 1671 / NRRL Y-8276) TaxID=1071382 RepID=H2APV1_KAZAF|nr:hypothetical protein KAFR_0B01030 [Kazachstania africana CBS 2517]CCF56401.1 hypothetical protein KAFR_0B01030 [Kazachstania africana CBS 2517]
MSKPNVIVIGAGGVGVIAAVSLDFNAKSNVSLVVRSDYGHVKEHGYTIKSCSYGNLDGWRPQTLFGSSEEASNSGTFFDYIVVTTKNIPDGPFQSRVEEVVRPVLESNRKLDSERQSNILLIQNGIDIEKDLFKTFSKQEYNYTALSGVQIVASTKVGRGVIDHIGPENLAVGAFDPSDRNAVEAAKQFISIYLNEGHNMAQFDERVRYSRWKKLLYNAAINTTTALVGLDVPRALEFGVNKQSTEFEIFKPAMREIIAIAAAEGIVLEEKFIDFFTDATRNLIFKPSMCVDMEKGQLMELEAILGNPLRIGKSYGIDAPILSMLYNLLHMLQFKLREQKGLLKFDEQTARIVD